MGGEIAKRVNKLIGGNDENYQYLYLSVISYKQPFLMYSQGMKSFVTLVMVFAITSIYCKSPANITT